MSSLDAVLFDFDNTLVNTASLLPFRERADFAAITDAHIAQTKIYLPVISMLRKLKAKGTRLGIVTNSPRSYIDRLLAYHELANLFDVVVCFNDVLAAGKKPSPKGLQLALHKLQVEPARAAFVGDDYTDVVAAYRAGVFPVIPTWASRESVTTPPGAELSSSGMLQVVDNFEDKFLFAERCALHQSTEFERTEARFLPLDENGNVATIRKRLATFCVGRYFSQKSPTTAALHDNHPLSLEIAKKDSDPNYRPPMWMAEMFLKITKSAGTYLFDGEFQIDLVTIIPRKPHKEPRLEYLLGNMAALAKQAGLPIEFRDNLLFFDQDASPSLRGKDAPERQIEQSRHLHASNVNLSGRRVLLIDDVITTGATINRGIALLSAAGAVSVQGLGLAKTVSIQEDTKPCPKCGRDMCIQKNKRTHERFWSCTGYFENKDCIYTEPFEIINCPKCNRPLRIFVNSKDGSRFYGCTGFRVSPACNYTRSIS